MAANATHKVMGILEIAANGHLAAAVAVGHRPLAPIERVGGPWSEVAAIGLTGAVIIGRAGLGASAVQQIGAGARTNVGQTQGGMRRGWGDGLEAFCGSGGESNVLLIHAGGAGARMAVRGIEGGRARRVLLLVGVDGRGHGGYRLRGRVGGGGGRS